MKTNTIIFFAILAVITGAVYTYNLQITDTKNNEVSSEVVLKAEAREHLSKELREWWTGYEASLLESIETITEEQIKIMNAQIENMLAVVSHSHADLMKPQEATKLRAQLRSVVTEDLESYLATVLTLIPAEDYQMVVERMRSRKRGSIALYSKPNLIKVAEVDLSNPEIITLNPYMIGKRAHLRFVLCHEVTHSLIQSHEQIQHNGYAQSSTQEAVTELLVLTAAEALGWQKSVDRQRPYEDEVAFVTLAMLISGDTYLRWYVANDRSIITPQAELLTSVLRYGCDTREAIRILESWNQLRQRYLLQKQKVHAIANLKLQLQEAMLKKADRDYRMVVILLAVRPYLHEVLGWYQDSGMNPDLRSYIQKGPLAKWENTHDLLASNSYLKELRPVLLHLMFGDKPDKEWTELQGRLVTGLKSPLAQDDETLTVLWSRFLAEVKADYEHITGEYRSLHNNAVDQYEQARKGLDHQITKLRRQDPPHTLLRKALGDADVDLEAQIDLLPRSVEKVLRKDQ